MATTMQRTKARQASAGDRGHTVRVSTPTYDRLNEMAAAGRKTIGEVVADLIEGHDKERFFQELEAAGRRLRADPVEWASFQAELAEWDGTLMDGLGNEPYPFDE